MGHNITALVTGNSVDLNKAENYELPVFNHGGFSIVGLDPYHSDYWGEKLSIKQSHTSPIILDDAVTHYFAKELGINKYALINTDYFGGIGEQYATVYDDGKRIMNVEKDAVNKALSIIGVKRWLKLDEFSTISLDSYRSFEDYFEKYYDDDL